MEYIIIILICLISLIISKFAFGIRIKDISKIKQIGNDTKINDIANKLPDNQKICEEILKILGNNKVRINVIEDSNKSLTYYSIVSNCIIITNIKDTFTRVQTIAHECLHSIQNRRMLLFNYIFSNVYLIYWIIICALTIANILEPSIIQVFILMILGLIFYMVRSYLETDAMIKAPYLAREYMIKSEIISNEDIKQILKEYKELNKFGIPMTNFLLFNKIIFKIIFLCIIGIIF